MPPGNAISKSCARRCPQGIPLRNGLSDSFGCPHDQQRAWRTGLGLPVSAPGLAHVWAGTGLEQRRPSGTIWWVQYDAIVSSPRDLVKSTVCPQQV